MSTAYPGGPDPRDNNHPENFGEGTYGQGTYGTPDAANQTPNYGYNGYGSDQPGGNSGYSGYDAFDVNAAAAGHGATQFHGTTLVDGTYGDGVQPHPVNNPDANGWHHVKGTGKMNPLEAWGFGFKQTFANWQTWIVIGLIAALVPALVSLVLPLLGSFLQIVLLFLYPFAYSFALLQTLSRRWKFDGMKAPAYGPTLGMMVLLGAVAFVILLVLVLISALFFAGSIAKVVDTLDPVQIENDPEALLPILGPVLGMLGLTFLAMLLIAPLFMFQTWYAADNATTFGNAFSEGFKAGTRNYGRILVFSLISGALLVGAGLVTALVAVATSMAPDLQTALIPFAFSVVTTIITPASILAMAYAYRQVSGGPVPTEPQAAL
ncbi:hypothetical protein G7Y29_10470 [Corynebacterium qintianiae]|uniref:Uncharacterized protein n=1 Tax=Corynebacterium qintianiae TaxID=2709392 RepID=A0A7T0KM24_9CORY|nr:hypothetical protein [Corynebacterium qintianiae]QPK83226.1 hypothetical protein G7Y29_10470 [Corynebacterium qintianiae]